MEDSGTVTFKQSDNPCLSNDDERESMLSDNESSQEIDDDLCSSRDDLINAGDGESVSNSLEKLVHNLSSQLQKGLNSVQTEVRKSLIEFEDKLDSMQTQINNVHSSNCAILQKDVNSCGLHIDGRHLNSTSNSEDTNNNGPNTITQSTPLGRNGNITDVSLPSKQYQPNVQGFEPDISHNRMKPQTYDGSDDLDEYLAQFNIVAELNKWNYPIKSLYLASSIVGAARAILCELDVDKRRDFNSIVTALQNRYGSVHKAEIFRSRLQSKTLGRNETIPELAQSVRKLTRKAYPSASSEVIDLLALDYFVDALPDADVRLRLREVGPKTISEAERIAVRLDAHKEADKCRGGRNHVRNVAPDISQTDKKLNDLSYQMKTLMDEVRDFRNKNETKVQNKKPYKSTMQYSRYNKRDNWANNYNVRNKNENHIQDRNQVHKQTYTPGNENGSNLRTEIRRATRGPIPYQ